MEILLILIAGVVAIIALLPGGARPPASRGGASNDAGANGSFNESHPGYLNNMLLDPTHDGDGEGDGGGGDGFGGGGGFDGGDGGGGCDGGGGGGGD